MRASRASPDRSGAAAARRRGVEQDGVDTRRTVVTLDGPAGSGKTVCGHRAALRLGATFVSSGLCYRAVAYLAMREGAREDDTAALGAAAERLRIEFVTTQSALRVLVDGADLTDTLKGSAVTARTRFAAEDARVRELIGRHLRRLAQQRDIVAEGRDMGTVVFADAPFKFFLDASLECRTARRRRELEALGAPVDERRLREEIAARDHRDRTRELCPLRVPEGAIVLRTDDMTVDEVADCMVRTVRGNAA